MIVDGCGRRRLPDSKKHLYQGFLERLITATSSRSMSLQIAIIQYDGMFVLSVSAMSLPTSRVPVR